MRLNKKEIFIKEKDSWNNSFKLDKKSKLILLEKEIFIHHIEYNKEKQIEIMVEGYIESMFKNYDFLTHYEKVKIGENKFIIIYSLRNEVKITKILDSSSKVSIVPYQFYLNKKIKGKSDLWDILIIKKENIIYFMLRVYNVILNNRNIEFTEDFHSIYLHISKLKKWAEEEFKLKEKYFRIISNMNLNEDLLINNTTYIKVVI
jgi:hypothetical protein